MLKDNLPWIIAGVVVLVVVIGGLALVRGDDSMASLRRGRRPRPGRDQFGSGRRETVVKRAGVVVNPTKFSDLALIRQRITDTCRANGWGDPLFYETSVDDPGTGQARQAIADGATVVCSLGGDGTVRAVAATLIGTDTPLGILPAGTGNLLARNLDLPVDAIDAAVVVALTGRNRRIDVGELLVRGEIHHTPDTPDTPETHDGGDGGDDPGSGEKHQFLVMGGMGFDAHIMAGTSETLKKHVGWPAYLVSGTRSLVSPEFRVLLSVDGAPEFKRRARAVMIGNCGKLVGGLVLMPAARVDDNQLDAVIVAPRGVVGWVPVAIQVMTRRRRGHASLDHIACREIRVRTDRPRPVQVDGDLIGEATEVTASVRPAALTVRVPLS